MLISQQPIELDRDLGITHGQNSRRVNPVSAVLYRRQTVVRVQQQSVVNVQAFVDWFGDPTTPASPLADRCGVTRV